MNMHPSHPSENLRATPEIRSDTASDLRSPNGYLVSITQLADIDSSMIDRWKTLEANASEPNPYLSADFIIPAARHLSNPTSLLMVAISDPEYCLRGILVITERSANLRFPFRHYALFKSPHSFIGGVLISKTHQKEVFDTIVYYFRSSRSKYKALYIDDLYISSNVYHHLSNTLFSGVYLHDSYRRAVIDLRSTTRSLVGALDHKKVKDLERCKRKFRKKGVYHWRIVEGPDITEDTVEAFLDLENKGWKGEKNTSIRSSPSEEAFFREMVYNFSRESRIFFTEILIDELIIASTCNFRIDNRVFAFKVSWDVDFRSFSPGMLNEYEFLHYLDRNRNSVHYVDSGSSHDSYIEKFWPDRAHIVNGYCLFSRPLLMITSLLSAIRNLLRITRRHGRQLISTIKFRGQ